MKKKIKIEQVSSFEKFGLFFTSNFITFAPVVSICMHVNLKWYTTVPIAIIVALLGAYILTIEVQNYRIIQYLKDKSEEG